MVTVSQIYCDWTARERLAVYVRLLQFVTVTMECNVPLYFTYTVLVVRLAELIIVWGNKLSNLKYVLLYTGMIIQWNIWLPCCQTVFSYRGSVYMYKFNIHQPALDPYTKCTCTIEHFKCENVAISSNRCPHHCINVLSTVFRYITQQWYTGHINVYCSRYIMIHAHICLM